jgi:hypothetical protein
MTSTLKVALLFTIFSFTAVAQAQNAGLTHTFPQVIDGVGSDGIVYTSRFMIASNSLSAATCQVSLVGLGPERLSREASIVVQGSSVETITTRGQDVMSTGYARLDCSLPVVASLTYSILSPTGTTLGLATVPSAPLASVVSIPMVLNGQYRYGIALANDSDAAQLIAILFDSDATSLVRVMQLQPRSHYTSFADEIFNIPAGGLGTLRIGAIEESGRFHITTVLFDQLIFTNVVPVVFR